MIKDLKLSLRASEFSLGDLEHPNKMPFQGILTYFDIPSDKAVGGSKGKKVLIPREFGIPSLASLKGMAVDFDPLLMDKHVATHKIGMIENAWAGDALEDRSVPVYVSGYVFAHDFPDEASDIKEFQSDLGFSYETINTPVVDGIYNDEQVLVVCGDVVFSGAAILLAEKAAYTRTSLAAQSEEQEVMDLPIDEIVEQVMAAMEAKYQMTPKIENMEMMAQEEIVAPLEEYVPAAEAAVNELVVEEPPAEEVPVTEEKPADQEVPTVENQVTDEEVKEEGVEVDEANPAGTVDFQAMAADLQASVEALKQELATFKAEAEDVQKNTHKGFAYPTTLAAKYNFEANAYSYEAQIAAIDARTDLSPSQASALKWELRAKELKK